MSERMVQAQDEVTPDDLGTRKHRDLKRTDLNVALESIVQRADRCLADVRRDSRREREQGRVKTENEVKAISSGRLLRAVVNIRIPRSPCAPRTTRPRV